MLGRPGTAKMLLTRALCACGLALALCIGAVAGSASAATIVYVPESQAALQSQLKAHEVQSVVVNKRVRSLRVTLKDGRYVLVKYPKHHEPETVAALKAGGVTVSILSSTQAKAEAKKQPVHHKLRYIAGGALIVVIVVVAAVLLVNRRRKMRAEE